MKNNNGKKLYELRTTINLEEMPPSLRADFSEILKKTIYDASSGYPTVTAFFVRYVPADAETIVGLRIEKSSESGIENIADALIDESLKKTVEEIGNQTRAVIEESELTLA